MLFRILLTLLLPIGSVLAQLTWGTNGAGGSGTWDTATQNWFNGTGNVAWDGNTANFGGSSGSVSISASGTIQANQLIFNTAGYVISSNSLVSPTDSNLNVTTDADATINSTISPVSSGNGLATLVKDGAGTLNLGGQVLNFRDIQINNGNLDFNSSSAMIYQGATLTLANTPPTALTLGINFSVGSLNGGGSSGGIVRPESTASAVTLTFNGGTGSYAGSLQDNGAAVLSLSTLNSPAQTLTGANTYSGTTQVTNGTLALGSLGSALNTSAITISAPGILILDNSGMNVGNRLPDFAAITLSGGLIFQGNSTAPSSEKAGALLSSGAITSRVTVLSDAAQPSSITFSSLGQASPSAVAVTLFRGANLGAVPAAGTANVMATSTPNLIGGGGVTGSTNISILPFALGDFSPTGNGTTFVTYGANGIRPLTNAEYATNNFSNAGTNVSADSNVTIPTVSVNSLRLKDGASIGGGGSLTVSSGAVLALPGNSSINTTQLNFGTNPIVFEIQGTTTIASTITGTETSRGFAKLGTGRLVLTGANNYAGQTRVGEGILNIQNSTALGTTSAGTSVLSGAILEIQGGINIAGETLTVSGTGPPGSSVFNTTGALRSVSGNNSWGGNVTLNQATIGVDSGNLVINGTTTVTSSLTKVGNGSLVLSNAISSSAALAVNAGWLTSKITSGTPFGMALSLGNGGIELAPAGAGGNISLSHNSTSSYNGNSSIRINKGANSSLTYQFGTAITRGSTGSTLVVMSAGGINTLGVSEKLRIGLTNTNGIVPTSVVGQDNDANLSAIFLTYNVTNGLMPATYSASTDINTSISSTVFQANNDQLLTANRAVSALQDNGHTIDLGTNQLLLTSGSFTVPSGIILNGGTIQNGTLNILNTEAAIYTSLAGGTISASIPFGSTALTLFGPGKLTLSGANNYAGNTVVNGGILNLEGTISSTTMLSPTATVTGTGKNTRNFAGGTISPGNSGPGILTAQFVDPRATNVPFQSPYTNFAFEFTKLGLPNFGSATASGNDVLHLTNIGSGFSLQLSLSNEIDLYFNTGFTIQNGQTFDGGFFTDNNVAFDSSIQGANYKVFVSDPLGATTFNGISYTSFDSTQILIKSVPQTADFGLGPINGYITEVQIVPEPATYLELAGGIVALVFLKRHRRQ